MNDQLTSTVGSISILKAIFSLGQNIFKQYPQLLHQACFLWRGERVFLKSHDGIDLNYLSLR